MAVVNGFGKVTMSGSVFMYDTGDTINSYIGEPTTNYQWNSGYEVTPWTVGGINTDVTNTVDQGPIKGAKTWKFQKTGTSNQWNGWESSYGGIWSGNSGDIWTTSYWYKTINDAGMGGFWVGAFYKPDWSAPYNTTVLANVSNIIPDGQWHYNYTVTRFNENYSNAIIVDGPSWGYSGQAGELYVNGLQWEKKPHSTPFAYGTRSATQGLLPIVSNSSINLSSVSFTSNAQITFDGTDDRFNTGVGNLGNNATYEAIIYCKGNVSTYNMFMGQFLPYIGVYNGNSIIYSDSINSTQRFPITSGGTISYNKYHHVVCTREYDGSNTTMKIYIDNVLQSQTNWSGAATYNNDTVNIGDGQSSTWYPFYGDIPIAKTYNRTLSSTEVQQNYNKYKTRFNLS